jgi:hypothetical protein
MAVLLVVRLTQRKNYTMESGLIAFDEKGNGHLMDKINNRKALVECIR